MAPLHFYIDQWSRLPANVEGDHLQGKTVILTGATSGIGLEAAHQLAVLRPGKLIITARNSAGGAKAIDEITKRTPGVKVDCWELDMSKFESVKAFGERANRELDKLDLFMANAGMQTGFDPARKIELTEDGHEVTVQTNVLSTILLVLLLHPVLAKAPQPRVVFTTSETAGWANHEYVAKGAAEGGILKTFNSAEKYVNPTRYFQSKLLLQMVIRHLIPAMPNVTIISTNPGLCYSRLGREIKFGFNLASIGMAMWFVMTARPASAGARTIVWSAVEAPDESCECHFHYFESPFLSTLTGMRTAEGFYHEVMDELERVAPGCTKALQGYEK